MASDGNVTDVILSKGKGVPMHIPDIAYFAQKN